MIPCRAPTTSLCWMPSSESRAWVCIRIPKSMAQFADRRKTRSFTLRDQEAADPPANLGGFPWTRHAFWPLLRPAADAPGWSQFWSHSRPCWLIRWLGTGGV
jgi:hypothetical protein